MIIANKEPWNDKWIITIEGISHAKPVVPNTLTTDEEIIAYLEQPLWNGMSWEQCQSEVDQINNGTASQEIIDRHTPKPAFDPEIAIGRQAQVIPIQRIFALSPFAYTINEFIRWQNWVQLKQFIVILMMQGIAIQEDYDNLNTILKEQGVDMDTI